jgi:hypothetical protein
MIRVSLKHDRFAPWGLPAKIKRGMPLVWLSSADTPALVDESLLSPEDIDILQNAFIAGKIDIQTILEEGNLPYFEEDVEISFEEDAQEVAEKVRLFLEKEKEEAPPPVVKSIEFMAQKAKEFLDRKGSVVQKEIKGLATANHLPFLTVLMQVELAGKRRKGVCATLRRALELSTAHANGDTSVLGAPKSSGRSVLADAYYQLIEIDESDDDL